MHCLHFCLFCSFNAHTCNTVFKTSNISLWKENPSFSSPSFSAHRLYCIQRHMRYSYPSFQRSHPLLFSSTFGTHWCYCRSVCSANRKRTARNNNSSRVTIGNWIGRRATSIYARPIFTSASDHARSSAAAARNYEENKLVLRGRRRSQKGGTKSYEADPRTAVN